MRIVAAQSIGLCDDLIIDASSSGGSGGRPFVQMQLYGHAFANTTMILIHY